MIKRDRERRPPAVLPEPEPAIRADRRSGGRGRHVPSNQQKVEQISASWLPVTVDPLILVAALRDEAPDLVAGRDPDEAAAAVMNAGTSEWVARAMLADWLVMVRHATGLTPTDLMAARPGVALHTMVPMCDIKKALVSIFAELSGVKVDVTLNRPRPLTALQVEIITTVLADAFGTDAIPPSKIFKWIFRDWCRKAYQDGASREAAAFGAAVQAREAILGCPDSRLAVIEFGRTWLGYRTMPESRFEALVDALLDDTWINHPDAADRLSARLRGLVDRLHEKHRMLVERRHWGRRGVSLDEPVGRDSASGQPVTLLSALADPHPVEEVVIGRHLGSQDGRVDRALATLRCDEYAIASAWANDNGCGSWTAAALDLGLEPGQGRRVQRKLARAGAELARRSLAIADVRQRGSR
jgi:hypothetical protein